MGSEMCIRDRASSVRSRVAQWQSSVLIRRRSVDRSHPRVPVSSRSGAHGSARDLGSRGRRFETCHRDQIVRALGCGRSSMEEPWAVNPLVPVRLRPVTPKRMWISRVANSSGREPGSYPGWSGFKPLATHHPAIPSWRNRQTHRSQKPGPAGHVRSTRTEGTSFRESRSSAGEQRPHKAKAGGSCPPRTTSNRNATINRQGGVT